MSIKTLLHNLKLLGFDESNHAKDSIKMNELLFSRGALNNDKALEYISLFLFRRLDRNRVKRELASKLTIHTYASKQNFITKVYKWLLEIRRQTHLLDGVPLRRSELQAYHGGNLIKIMVAFSTYVLESTMKNTDVGKISKLSSVAIQNSIVEANQFFNLSTETSNTYSSKATKAARDISTELSFSPPSPPPPSPPPPSLPPPSSSPPPPLPSQDIIPLKSDRIEQLSGHLGSIIKDAQSVSQESNATEEPASPVFYEQASNISFFSAAAPNIAVDEPSLPSAITRSSSYELDSAEPKVPEINSSNAKGPIANVYLQEGSRIIRTPDWIPRPLTPDQQLDLPDVPSQPIPRTTMPNTSSISRNTIRQTPSPVVLTPMQFNYMTEPGRLPPLRDIILENSLHLPTGLDYLVLPPLQADYSPDLNATYVPASPPSPSKRKHDQVDTEDNEDNVVVPPSPPRRKRRISYGTQDECVLTPTDFYEMDMVPPLMDEAAPFRRIYQTEYFDIDFMTPNR